MAHGKTLLLNNIRMPAPIVIHRHVGAPRRVRRDDHQLTLWRGSFMQNDPYIDPARDERKGRHLREAS